jgi:hypothetical protein
MYEISYLVSILNRAQLTICTYRPKGNQRTLDNAGYQSRKKSPGVAGEQARRAGAA